MKTKQELKEKALEFALAQTQAEAEYNEAMKQKRKAQATAAAALQKATRAKIQYMRIMGAIEESEDEVVEEVI